MLNSRTFRGFVPNLSRYIPLSALPRLDLELVRRTAERNVDDLNLPLWEAARRAALITT